MSKKRRTYHVFEKNGDWSPEEVEILDRLGKHWAEFDREEDVEMEAGQLVVCLTEEQALSLRRELENLGPGIHYIGVLGGGPEIVRLHRYPDGGQGDIPYLVLQRQEGEGVALEDGDVELLAIASNGNAARGFCVRNILPRLKAMGSGGSSRYDRLKSWLDKGHDFRLVPKDSSRQEPRETKPCPQGDLPRPASDRP